jgi:hypothetical protein
MSIKWGDEFSFIVGRFGGCCANGDTNGPLTWKIVVEGRDQWAFWYYVTQWRRRKEQTSGAGLFSTIPEENKH